MKKLIIMFALLLGVVSMKAQSNDLYQGITKKLPYRQMVDVYKRQVRDTRVNEIVRTQKSPFHIINRKAISRLFHLKQASKWEIY